ncbi:putative membrane protein [Acinetobacter baumannii 348935]|nr:putative membrane protein [Acinetobacter baumannii 348935]
MSTLSMTNVFSFIMQHPVQVIVIGLFDTNLIIFIFNMYQLI